MLFWGFGAPEAIKPSMTLSKPQFYQKFNCKIGEFKKVSKI